MDILLENFEWIILNFLLAVLGVIFGFIYFYLKNPYFRKVFFVLWLLFLPNTIYLVTDMQYFPEQFVQLNSWMKILLLIQYGVVFATGLITYFLGIIPMEKILSKLKKKNKQFRDLALFFLNFSIAFALILGKIERINSWEVFTNPQGALNGILNLLGSQNLLLIIFFTGIFINLLYFSLRGRFKINKLFCL